MTRKKHDKPSIEGIQKICAVLQAQFPEKYKFATTKIAYDTKSEAKSGAKRFDPSHNQKPYLCRWCGYWHIGKSANVNTKELQFVVPVKDNLIVSEFVPPDSPLALEVYRLELSEFFPVNHSQLKSLNGYIRNYENLYSINDMKIFSVQPHLRAVAWAIHIIPFQPIFLKDGDFFTFRKFAGNYWQEKSAE